MKTLALRIAAAPALLLPLLLDPVSATLFHPFHQEVPLVPTEDGTTGSRIQGEVPRLRGEKGAAVSVRRPRGPPRASTAGRSDRGRQLVSGGTPTGGKKYPFLALVQYTNESSKERNAFRPVRTYHYHTHNAVRCVPLRCRLSILTSHACRFCFSQAPYCHGVMVAKDVLLKPAWCDVLGTSRRRNVGLKRSPRTQYCVSCRVCLEKKACP